MNTGKRISDTPKVDRDDSLRVELKPHPFSFKESPNNQLNERVVEAINMMGGVGSEAEAYYQSALEALRKQSAEVTSLVAAEYRSLPRDQYLDRWSLVQLLAELRDPSSLPILDEIISARLPTEQSKDPHSFSTVGEEIMIRTTAVEAVTRIASKDERALEILIKHVQHKNFSIKRAAIQGYLEQGGKDAREVLANLLSQKERSILDIRRIDVRQVPQAEGGLFLANRDIDELPPPQLPNKTEDRQ
jgi:HEAT repeat protein